jgi:Protein of unknown function (DUF541)
MKSVIAATFAVAAGLLCANMLGVALGEAPTSTSSPRTVNVQGVAKVPVAQGASTTTATEGYRQAMAAAVSDGLSKAELLASKAGVGLGAVQNIIEDGGNISCAGGPEAEYVEYDGQQPDFPLDGATGAPVPFAAAVRGAKVAVPKSKAKHGKKTPKAKKATAGTCTLSAQVTLVYAIV